MEQESLFEPLNPTQATIRLDEIEPWSNDGARSPIKGSISALGMVDPVTVQALYAGQRYKYRVRAGKRRLSTCRDLGIERVPAVVLPAEIGEIEGALIPLAENILRRENPLHEAREIQHFYDACRASGMPQGEIRPYLTGCPRRAPKTSHPGPGHPARCRNRQGQTECRSKNRQPLKRRAAADLRGACGEGQAQRS